MATTNEKLAEEAQLWRKRLENIEDENNRNELAKLVSLRFERKQEMDLFTEKWKQELEDDGSFNKFLDELTQKQLLVSWAQDERIRRSWPQLRETDQARVKKTKSGAGQYAKSRLDCSSRREGSLSCKKNMARCY